jgi:hypothetical protein
VLDLCLREEDAPKSTLSDKDADLSCEVLKVLFNLTVAVDKNSLDEEEEAHFMRLVSVLHDLLLIETATKDKKEEVERWVLPLPRREFKMSTEKWRTINEPILKH